MRIAGKFGQIQRLGDDALAGERCVAVHADRHDAITSRIAEDRLLAADDSLLNRVDQFQVRWIRQQRNLHGRAVVDGAVVGIAQVIFHVAVAAVIRGGRSGAHEFAEHHFVRLVQHMREHIQPAAMRHGADELFAAQHRAFVDERVDQRDQRFGPFEAESLRADERAMQILFEFLGGDELEHQRFGFFRAEVVAG